MRFPYLKRFLRNRIYRWGDELGRLPTHLGIYPAVDELSQLVAVLDAFKVRRLNIGTLELSPSGRADFALRAATETAEECARLREENAKLRLELDAGPTRSVYVDSTTLEEQWALTQGEEAGLQDEEPSEPHWTETVGAEFD